MTFNGLTDNQAENRRKQYGSNRIKEQPPITAIGGFCERFGRVSVKIYVIIQLCCLIFGIIFSLGSGLSDVITCVIAVLIQAAAVFIGCLCESACAGKSGRKKSAYGEPLCKVYRCGNSVSLVKAEDIVKGDYVLLTAGDIVPAEGIVQTGDVTIESDGRTELIRRKREDELDEDITGEYTLEKGTVITSGYAVIKITSVSEGFTKQSVISTRFYTISIIICSIIATALTIFSAYSAEKSGNSFLPIQISFYSSLILIAGIGLKDPLAFFLSICKRDIRINGADIRRLTPKCDYFFIDKNSFAADGRAEATGFTDGNGVTYTRFYEVPYPLGTVAVTAAAENTSALVNKGRIFSSDPYESAEMTFMAERLKSTVELEITAELVKGKLPPISCKRYLRGEPNALIDSCKTCFDGSGKEKEFTSSAAVKALANELIFQGSTVIAYAAELWDGKHIFIGMLTIREKYRSGTDNAFKELAECGCHPILLVKGEASLPDKAAASAGSGDSVSFSELMSEENPLARLKKVKIITGNYDKKALLELCSGKKVGVSAVTVEDSTLEASVVYTAEGSCAAATDIADCVSYNGITGAVMSIKCTSEIKKAAAVYNIIRSVMLLLTALTLYFGAEIGVLFCIAVIMILGGSAALIGNICKKRCSDI